MNESVELVLGEPEPEFRCSAGSWRSALGALVLILSFPLVAWLAHLFGRSLPCIPPGGTPFVPVAGAALWGILLFSLDWVSLRLRARPFGRFAFGEQIEVSLIEGWCALVSYGEVLSYSERGRGVELHTTRPPPRPNKPGILPDLPQTLWVPTRDEAERAQLLRLLRAKKIPRLG